MARVYSSAHIRLCGLLALVALPLGGCIAPEQSALLRYEFSQPQMGVPFRIVLYAPGLAAAEVAAKAAFHRISELNGALSDYEDESELTRLSRSSGTGAAVRLGPDLWKVLKYAQDLARRTDGAFDVTVGPCVSLWRKARRERRLPDGQALARAMQSVGYRKLVLDDRNRTALLEAQRMRLDLGGIAKGYAVDEALRVLRQHGVRRALVSGGGDMAAGDPPPGKPGWRVEVAPIDVTNAPPPRYVMLAGMALATSGDVFQRLEIDGRRFSHILDPRTGIGLTDHSLVTVIASDCMAADSLATAVSVLGPRAGASLVDSIPKGACFVARQPAPGQVLETVETKRFARHLDKQKPSSRP